jgi:hypothetical protein
MKNKKLILAIDALNELRSLRPRESLRGSIYARYVSLLDPWVAAALGCANDADIPDVALEFFLADVKAGYYDLHAPDPIASP